MSFTTRPELQGTFGMAASTHWIASAVGMKLLEAGGTAADAAVGGRGGPAARGVRRSGVAGGRRSHGGARGGGRHCGDQ